MHFDTLNLFGFCFIVHNREIILGKCDQHFFIFLLDFVNTTWMPLVTLAKVFLRSAHSICNPVHFIFFMKWCHLVIIVLSENLISDELNKVVLTGYRYFS